jgi:hypothetical protein
MKKQLHFALSLFDINPDVDLSQAVMLNTTPSVQPSGDQPGVSSGGSAAPPVIRPSFADAVRHNLPSSIALQQPLRQALLSAVYVEDRQKKERERNFVISGLPCDCQLTDAEFVQNLCHYELDVNADIVRCFRLGTPIEGRVQLVKVVTKTAAQAAQIVGSAKRLRQSANTFVAEHVFINADLTPAQSRAAYEERQRRRESNRRTQQQRRSATNSQRFVSADVSDDRSHRQLNKQSVVQSTGTDSSASSFNPDVDEFVPLPHDVDVNNQVNIEVITSDRDVIGDLNDNSSSA